MANERTDERITVEVERSGGFGGLTVRSRVDSADLPPQEAARLAELVREAGLDTITPLTAAPRVPDAASHRIVVIYDGRPWHLSLSDVEIPPRLRPLLAYVLGRGTAERGPRP